MKMYLDPPRCRGITVQDRLGRTLTDEELRELANRRVRWARREGERLAVMVDGPVRGEEGVLLYFPRPVDYDASVRRVFAASDGRG